MYSIVDALIFPAPASSYTREALAGKLIYIPKYPEYQPSKDILNCYGNQI